MNNASKKNYFILFYFLILFIFKPFYIVTDFETSLKKSIATRIGKESKQWKYIDNYGVTQKK